MGILALFEKIYDGEPILTVFSLIEEDVSVKGFMWKLLHSLELAFFLLRVPFLGKIYFLILGALVSFSNFRINDHFRMSNCFS